MLDRRNRTDLTWHLINWHRDTSRGVKLALRHLSSALHGTSSFHKSTCSCCSITLWSMISRLFHPARCRLSNRLCLFRVNRHVALNFFKYLSINLSVTFFTSWNQHLCEFSWELLFTLINQVVWKHTFNSILYSLISRTFRIFPHWLWIGVNLRDISSLLILSISIVRWMMRICCWGSLVASRVHVKNILLSLFISQLVLWIRGDCRGLFDELLIVLSFLLASCDVRCDNSTLNLICRSHMVHLMLDWIGRHRFFS